MVTYATIKKVTLVIFLLLIAGIVSGQTRLRDVPLVVDKQVAKTDTIRIVERDEQQRIVNELIERIQKLEEKVSSLEIQVRNLQSQVEGG